MTGTLNFLNRAIVPGRAFTRGMYASLKFADRNGNKLKQFHHVNLKRDFIQDCQMWKSFLSTAVNMPKHLYHPFVDFETEKHTSTTLQFFSDASKKDTLGMGTNFKNKWLVAQWPENFIKIFDPSIKILELLALTMAVLAWNSEPELQDGRITVHCDNQVVVHMINSSASSCDKCHKLLRVLTMEDMLHNRRLFATYIRSRDNVISDTLSRLDYKRFWDNVPKTMNPFPDHLLELLWPPMKLWDNQAKLW